VNVYEELRALLQRYARAADERDLESLATLFHPKAEISGSQGAQDVDGWLDKMRAPRAFPQSMHVIGDPLIDLKEGGKEAHLDTYAIVHQLNDPASGKADLTLGIRYLDLAVLHHGRWVIRRRLARTLWMR
jgi:hypothetical protein